MVDPNNYFAYLNKWKVLVCRGCKYGLHKDGVIRHLQDKHKVIPLTICNMLVAYAKTLSILLPSKVETTSIEIPIQVIDCLELRSDGYRCTKCNALCGTSNSIKKHCRAQHNWVESQGKGI